MKTQVFDPFPSPDICIPLVSVYTCPAPMTGRAGMFSAWGPHLLSAPTADLSGWSSRGVTGQSKTRSSRAFGEIFKNLLTTVFFLWYSNAIRCGNDTTPLPAAKAAFI